MLKSPPIEAARDAVRMACVVARHVGRHRDALFATTKKDRSPVTVADFASQAVVAHVLEASLGPACIVGEETADSLAADSALLDATREAVHIVWPEATSRDVVDAIERASAEPSEAFWTLDPIDGTKGFLRGGQFCVSLAYIERGSPVVGVLGCPHLPLATVESYGEPSADGSRYSAERTRGAFASALDDEAWARIVEVPHTGPLRLAESFEPSHSDHVASHRLMDALGTTPKDAIRIDSQCKYALVATGRADAYVRLPRHDYIECIWDHAAGAILAAEAECIVTDALGCTLDFSTGRRLERNRGIVVARPALHARIIDAIRQLALL